MFKVLAKCSGLNVKASKCVLIPLGAVLSSELTDRIREFLTVRIPAWTSLDVSAFGTYFELIVGPGADDKAWIKPALKWSSRALALAQSRLSPNLGVREFNSRAFSCLSYVAQLMPPPAQLYKQEKSLTQKTMHQRNNTLPPGFHCRVSDIGMTAPQSLAAMCLVAYFRTARYTIPEYRNELQALREASQTNGLLAMLVGEKHV